MSNNKQSNIEKEFIPYEEALTLKELGFNEPCHRGWDEDYKIWYHPDSSIVVDNPTFSQAFRWFREKHNTHSFIIPLVDEMGFVHEYQVRIHIEESSVEIIGNFEIYEEAELACLIKLIEIVKNKQ